MTAIRAVNGLICSFCHFVSFKFCSDWLFWHYSDHISVHAKISSISENLFILSLQTSRQCYKVFKIIDSLTRVKKIKVDTLTY